MMIPLWNILRWMAEVVVNGEIENEWFFEMPDEALEYMYELGQNLVAIFG